MDNNLRKEIESFVRGIFNVENEKEDYSSIKQSFSKILNSGDLKIKGEAVASAILDLLQETGINMDTAIYALNDLTPSICIQWFIKELFDKNVYDMEEDDINKSVSCMNEEVDSIMLEIVSVIDNNKMDSKKSLELSIALNALAGKILNKHLSLKADGKDIISNIKKSNSDEIIKQKELELEKMKQEIEKLKQENGGSDNGK